MRTSGEIVSDPLARIAWLGLVIMASSLIWAGVWLAKNRRLQAPLAQTMIGPL